MAPAPLVVLREGSTIAIQAGGVDWCGGNKSRPEATATVSEARGSS